MRQVLFEIPLKSPWHLGPFGDVPGFGFGIVLLVWLVWGGFSLYRDWKLGTVPGNELMQSLVFFLAMAGAIVAAPSYSPVGSLPVFGYGAMLVVGAGLSGLTASRRIRLVGGEPKIAWDMTVMLILTGVVGSRIFYLVQKREQVFAHCTNFFEVLKAIVNLPDGGLVLYGGLILGSATYVLLCRKHGLDALKVGDAVVPAVFVGEACGRIGCFLNGCCFGDACSLPWGVQFPRDSVPWTALENRGFLLPIAEATYPLHPTQLYSAINALVLAGITAIYYRYRAGNGSVLALAIMAYAVSRSCLEILRGDEFGQFGTGLTIAQCVSIVVFFAGAALAVWSWRHSERGLRSAASS